MKMVKIYVASRYARRVVAYNGVQSAATVTLVDANGVTTRLGSD